MKLLTRLKYAIQCSVPKGMTSAVSMMSISEQPDQPLAALLQDTIILYEDYERKSNVELTLPNLSFQSRIKNALLTVLLPDYLS